MARRIDVPFGDLRPFLDRLEARVRNLGPLLKQMGAIMAARAQRAFEEQKLGDERWPERYPGQPEPFINVAGALSDLNRGRSVLARQRRFERRPALIDSANMRNSITFRVLGKDRMEWGTAAEYANVHQQGGETVQKVSQGARDQLAKDLKKARRTGDARLEAMKKLGFLFTVNELRTQVNRRPFVGLTVNDGPDMRELTEDYVAGSSR